MKKDLRAGLCLVLSVCMALSGCAMRVKMDSHRTEGELSDVKVALFWRAPGGDRHCVGGMRVELTERISNGRTFCATTRTDEAIYFPDLLPGQYNVRVTADGREYFDENVTLRAGRCLSIKGNVTGSLLADGAKEAAICVGKATVVVLAVAAVLAVIYLDATLDYEACHNHRRH